MRRQKFLPKRDNLDALSDELDAELQALKEAGKAAKNEERKLYFRAYYQAHRVEKHDYYKSRIGKE